MSFTPPSNLKDLVIYWWKIIDRPSIAKDSLINYITFDLSMFNLSNTKKILSEGISRGFLVENSKTEEIKLGQELEDEFIEWQENGTQKSNKMKNLLDQKWRKPTNFTDEIKFKIYFNDFSDQSTQKRALYYSPSNITYKISGDNVIKGTFEDSINEEEDVEYTFLIDEKNRILKHDCPYFQDIGKKSKKFCIHLTKLISKMNLEDTRENKKYTLNLLEDFTSNLNQWNFK